ncbi:hypothetical protein M0R45_001568 [Rubus argutus]|uniref:Uncharacterized protein n=1 Tax=Rubus argutus TaxID=59490 RepID=A0AAW1VMI1_RUBAR
MNAQIDNLSTAQKKHDETLVEMRKIQAQLEKEQSLRIEDAQYEVNSKDQQHSKGTQALSNRAPFKGYSTMGSSSRQKYDQAVKDYSDLRHMLNTKRQVYEEKETTEKGGADDDAQSKVDHEKEKSKEGLTDMEKILETMKEMNAKIEEKLEARLGILEAEKGLKPMELTLATTSSPFTKEILEFKLPRDFKQPKIRLYDGTTDPVDFLSDFALWMDVKEVGDAMKC